MLQITIPAGELFNESTSEFIAVKEHNLQLEHSLVSLSKWEQKWHKPFLDYLTNGKLTFDQTIDYIKFMTLTKNVDPNCYLFLTEENIEAIKEYISNPMTATTFSNEPAGGRSGEKITNEILYYDMVALNIPFECEKWHLNRLMTLIKVCNIKSQPPKRMGKGDIMRSNAALNAARRKQHNTKG